MIRDQGNKISSTENPPAVTWRTQSDNFSDIVNFEESQMNLDGELFSKVEKWKEIEVIPQL